MSNPWPSELQAFRDKLEAELRAQAMPGAITEDDVQSILDEVLERQTPGDLHALAMGDAHGTPPRNAAWIHQAAWNLLMCRASGTPHA